MFFTKNKLFAERSVLYGEKSFYNEKFFYWKNFFTEKNINENVKNIYLISEICFYTENVCAKIKYKSFLNICSFCKKNYFDHKKYIC